MIDHYLQADILKKLSQNNGAIRFSELKVDGVENSLFMYHANKLIDRQLIEKTEDGFKITLKGARYVNNSSPSLLKSVQSPKVLVQIVIKSGENVLLGQRTGSMKDLLNEFLLPGGYHIFGKTAEESAKQFLDNLFDSAPEPKFLTDAEIIEDIESEYIHHVISHIFEIELPDMTEAKSIDNFEYSWKKLSEIKDDYFADSLFLTEFFRRWPNIKSREQFLQEGEK